MVELRPSSEEFAKDYLLWREGKVGRKYNPVVDLSESEAKIRLQSSRGNFKLIFEKKELIWIAFYNERPIGSVSLKDANPMMNTAEIGYFLDEKHHGQGLGKAMVKKFVSDIFLNTPLRRLIASVHEDHIASRKILEGLDFQCEGLFREHFIINGDPVNEAYYGLLKSEWSGS